MYPTHFLPLSPPLWGSNHGPILVAGTLLLMALRNSGAAFQNGYWIYFELINLHFTVLPCALLFFGVWYYWLSAGPDAAFDDDDGTSLTDELFYVYLGLGVSGVLSVLAFYHDNLALTPVLDAATFALSHWGWDHVIFYADPMSLNFLLLTHFLMMLCVGLLLPGLMVDPKAPIALGSLSLLWVQLVITFLASDLLTFFLAFESLMLPLIFLMGIWGSSERLVGVAYLYFFTAFSAQFMLAGVLYLWSHAGTLHLPTLMVTAEDVLTAREQLWVWCGLFVALAVKTPLVPFHVWLPQAHVEASTIGSVILAGILLKIGIYGAIRFCLAVFVDVSLWLAPAVATAAVCGMIYASLVTLRQVDMKRIIAYSSVVHMSLALASILTVSELGIAAGLFMALSHGVVSGALFILVGALYARFHNRLAAYYGGLVAVMPYFAVIFFGFSLANMAFPFTSGFIAEFLCLTALVGQSTFLGVVAASSMLFTTVYTVALFNRTFLGNCQVVVHGTTALPALDVTRAEVALVVPALALAIGAGVYPDSLLSAVTPGPGALPTLVFGDWLLPSSPWAVLGVPDTQFFAEGLALFAQAAEHYWAVDAATPFLCPEVFFLRSRWTEFAALFYGHFETLSPELVQQFVDLDQQWGHVVPYPTPLFLAVAGWVAPTSMTEFQTQHPKLWTQNRALLAQLDEFQKWKAEQPTARATGAWPASDSTALARGQKFEGWSQDWTNASELKVWSGPADFFRAENFFDLGEPRHLDDAFEAHMIRGYKDQVQKYLTETPLWSDAWADVKAADWNAAGQAPPSVLHPDYQLPPQLAALRDVPALPGESSPLEWSWRGAVSDWWAGLFDYWHVVEAPPVVMPEVLATARLSSSAFQWAWVHVFDSPLFDQVALVVYPTFWWAVLQCLLPLVVTWWHAEWFFLRKRWLLRLYLWWRRKPTLLGSGPLKAAWDAQPFCSLPTLLVVAWVNAWWVYTTQLNFTEAYEACEFFTQTYQSEFTPQALAAPWAGGVDNFLHKLWAPGGNFRSPHYALVYYPEASTQSRANHADFCTQINHVLNQDFYEPLRRSWWRQEWDWGAAVTVLLKCLLAGDTEAANALLREWRAAAAQRWLQAYLATVEQQRAQHAVAPLWAERHADLQQWRGPQAPLKTLDHRYAIKLYSDGAYMWTKMKGYRPSSPFGWELRYVPNWQGSAWDTYQWCYRELGRPPYWQLAPQLVPGEAMPPSVRRTTRGVRSWLLDAYAYDLRLQYNYSDRRVQRLFSIHHDWPNLWSQTLNWALKRAEDCLWPGLLVEDAALLRIKKAIDFWDDLVYQQQNSLQLQVPEGEFNWILDQAQAHADARNDWLAHGRPAQAAQRHWLEAVESDPASFGFDEPVPRHSLAYYHARLPQAVEGPRLPVARSASWLYDLEEDGPRLPVAQPTVDWPGVVWTPHAPTFEDLWQDQGRVLVVKNWFPEDMLRERAWRQRERQTATAAWWQTHVNSPWSPPAATHAQVALTTPDRASSAYFGRTWSDAELTVAPRPVRPAAAPAKSALNWGGEVDLEYKRLLAALITAPDPTGSDAQLLAMDEPPAQMQLQPGVYALSTRNWGALAMDMAEYERQVAIDLQATYCVRGAESLAPFSFYDFGCLPPTPLQRHFCRINGLPEARGLGAFAAPSESASAVVAALSSVDVTGAAFAAQAPTYAQVALAAPDRAASAFFGRVELSAPQRAALDAALQADMGELATYCLLGQEAWLPTSQSWLSLSEFDIIPTCPRTPLQRHFCPLEPWLEEFWLEQRGLAAPLSPARSISPEGPLERAESFGHEREVTAALSSVDVTGAAFAAQAPTYAQVALAAPDRAASAFFGRAWSDAELTVAPPPRAFSPAFDGASSLAELMGVASPRATSSTVDAPAMSAQDWADMALALQADLDERQAELDLQATYCLLGEAAEVPLSSFDLLTLPPTPLQRHFGRLAEASAVELPAAPSRTRRIEGADPLGLARLPSPTRSSASEREVAVALSPARSISPDPWGLEHVESGAASSSAAAPSATIQPPLSSLPSFQPLLASNAASERFESFWGEDVVVAPLSPARSISPDPLGLEHADSFFHGSTADLALAAPNRAASFFFDPVGSNAELLAATSPRATSSTVDAPAMSAQDWADMALALQADLDERQAELDLQATYCLLGEAAEVPLSSFDLLTLPPTPLQRHFGRLAEASAVELPAPLSPTRSISPERGGLEWADSFSEFAAAGLVPDRAPYGQVAVVAPDRAASAFFGRAWSDTPSALAKSAPNWAYLAMGLQDMGELATYCLLGKSWLSLSDFDIATLSRTPLQRHFGQVQLPPLIDLARAATVLTSSTSETISLLGTYAKVARTAPFAAASGYFWGDPERMVAPLWANRDEFVTYCLLGEAAWLPVSLSWLSLSDLAMPTWPQTPLQWHFALPPLVDLAPAATESASLSYGRTSDYRGGPPQSPRSWAFAAGYESDPDWHPDPAHPSNRLISSSALVDVLQALDLPRAAGAAGRSTWDETPPVTPRRAADPAGPPV